MASSSNKGPCIPVHDCDEDDTPPAIVESIATTAVTSTATPSSEVTKPPKGSKKKSTCWEHFIKRMDLDPTSAMELNTSVSQATNDPIRIFQQSEKQQATEEGKTELDVYLADQREDFSDDFDILNWWKVNSSKYKILSLIARDVLAMQLSTVASESAFSTGGRVLNEFRSSLAPKTVQALICAQNWLRNQPTVNLEELLEGIEKIDLDASEILEEIPDICLVD